MVESVVKATLNESVSEIMGSAMSEKDKVIDEIVDYIYTSWIGILVSREDPINTGSFGIKNKDDVNLRGTLDIYSISLPMSLTRKLDIAENFAITVQVNNFIITNEETLSYFGPHERSTEGSAVAGGKYDLYNSELKMLKNGNISLVVPAINNELQTDGIYTTLYHELNHAFSHLQVQNGGLKGLNLSTATNRRAVAGVQDPHQIVQLQLHTDNPAVNFLQTLQYSEEEREWLKMINFLFYAIWEITERNARAEEIYGDLYRLKDNARRKNFKEIYPQTSVYRNIKDYQDLIDELEQVPEHSKVWTYAADIMNLNLRSKNDDKKNAEMKRREVAKKRFLKRSREHLEALYKKAMKVASLYFQKYNWLSPDEYYDYEHSKFGENGYDNK